MNQLTQFLVDGILNEDKQEIIGIYAGGFKPPTAGHFAVVEEALKQYPEIDKLIVLVGSGIRDGIEQAESILVWEIYQNYLPMKVEIQAATKPPIGAVYSYAKNNPEDTVYWILGARDGNDEDLSDIVSRTAAIDKKEDKYNNVEVKIITTSNKGMSGTNARKALLSGDKETFFKFIPTIVDEKEEIFSILRPAVKENIPDAKDDGKSAPYGSGYEKVDSKNEGFASTFGGGRSRYRAIEKRGDKYWFIQDNPFSPGIRQEFGPYKTKEQAKKKMGSFPPSQNYKDINENASYSKDIDIQGKIDQLTQHMIDKGYNIEPLPGLEFVDGDTENARDFFGKTAYYDPSTQTIVLYTEGRHPKDIARSYAHEMIHHIQNLEGRLGNITTTNTQEDDYLNDIEAEANLKGTMTFRNWTDSLNENLNEGPQFGVLYHFTQELETVLSDDRLRAPISLTRSLDSYVTQWLGDQPYFIFDKDKLLTKYKITPFKDTSDNEEYEDISQYDEMEEVIKKDITNLARYTIKVVLPYPDKDWEDALKEKGISYEIGKPLNEAIVGDKIECDNCGWSWKIVDGGDDLFICHKCDHDNTPINEVGFNKNLGKDPFGLEQFARELAQGLEEAILTEGRYDKSANQFSNIVFDMFKSIHDRGDKKGEFELSVGPNDEDIYSKEFEFDLAGVVEITDDEYKVDGGANAGFDNEGEEITPLLSVKFKIPKNPDWQRVSFDIKDVVRHELEHLTQDGLNVKPSKQMDDDQLFRDMIDADLLPKADYFRLEKEIDAMMQGLYFKAKKSRRPFKDVIDDYLNTQPISKEEKEDIINLWRSRRKALSLPVFENKKQVMDYKIYLDMDGVITDFDQQFKELTGLDPRTFEAKHGTDMFWQEIDRAGVGFWRGMKWMDGGEALYNRISQFDHELLSSPSRGDSSKIGKRLWRRDKTPSTKLTLAYSAKKKNYAAPNHILIDDRADNINQWKAAGGIGILYTSFDQASKELDKLGL